jgi:hypothetical protein
MLTRLFEWYRVVNPNPSDDIIEKRKASASALLEHLTANVDHTFEDRVRRLRKWVAGVLPKKLADHTILSDSRNPSLLHIALREVVDRRRRFDLLLTDLPGEWTKSLIDNAESEKRFRFLHRADGIIIVIDGPSLVSDRHVEIFNAKLLLSRLAESVKLDLSVPIIILISKCDKLDGTLPADIHKLVEHGVKLGFALDVIMAAAFSSVPEKIANGTGVISREVAIAEAIGRHRQAVFEQRDAPRHQDRFPQRPVVAVFQMAIPSERHKKHSNKKAKGWFSWTTAIWCNKSTKVAALAFTASLQ